MKRISEKRRLQIERTVEKNRAYKAFLYNRMFVYCLLILLQVGVGCAVAHFIAYRLGLGIAMQVAIELVALVMVVAIVNKQGCPTQKLGWVMLILLLPFIGVPAYLFYGEGRQTRGMQKKLLAAKKENEKRFQEFFGERARDLTECGSLEWYLEREGSTAYGEGGICYYDSGEKAFPEMLNALRSAQEYVFLEYFIIAYGVMWKEILKILLEKAEQGVKIRIIYDGFGCIVTLPPRYSKYLESLHRNIRCVEFNHIVPFVSIRMNNRDHRKILVVDGKIAFTGGINLADEYIAEKRRFGYWKDSVLKMTGAPVNAFVKTFLDAWNGVDSRKEDIAIYLRKNRAEKSGYTIQPFDDSPLDKSRVGERAYADIIARARRYLYISTPYLMLDDYLRETLIQAAERGVDVRLVTPGIPDKKIAYRITRANYPPLLKAGVKIYEYAPGFIHAKSMLADGERAIVGTINLDYRSLHLHFENAVYFTEKKALGELERDYEETFAAGKLCLENSPKRNGVGRLADSLLRLFETLF